MQNERFQKKHFLLILFLTALQQERSQVEELENELVQLELNNSLSSELINSRDSLIEELNSRISVFEEDKIVLKVCAMIMFPSFQVHIS